MILGIFETLDDLFTQLEKFVANHADNPILWIMILAVLLLIVAAAYNALSK